MKTLVLVFHPDMTASRVNRALAEQAERLGGDIVVRRMYDIYPDFHIDVAAEQQALTAADRIVLQFPMYWFSTPPATQEVGGRCPHLRLGIRLNWQGPGRQGTPHRLLPRLYGIRARRQLHLHGARVAAPPPSHRLLLLPDLS